MGQVCCTKYSARPGDKVHASCSGCRQEERCYPEWSAVDKAKCKYTEIEFTGNYSFSKSHAVQFEEHPEDGDDSNYWNISDALEYLKENPEMYYGMMYQSDMINWPQDQQKAKLICRNGSGFDVKAQPGGGFTFVQVKFVALDDTVEDVPDDYTDSVLNTCGGRQLGKPKRPGRGEGCADVPTITLMDETDPTDVSQGQVGDCWLLSAISGLAEFDGAIAKLFAKTLAKSSHWPNNEFNTYSVTLYSLPDYTPTVIEVDERLCTKDGDHLLGAQPTRHGELWPCILEKAVAAHCGGWDEIDGGTCTHAWRLLTGCEECYTMKKEGEDEWRCFGTKNANTGKWEVLANSPHKGFQGLWPMHWPGHEDGDIDEAISADDMFSNIAYWCNECHYILGAGTKSGSDTEKTDGIVDGHAYTILAAHEDVCDTGINLIYVRNPWGKGEMESGKWDDDGTGWEEYPKIKEFLDPIALDDGKFWMSQDEFFQYFPTIYLCAQDMGSFHK